jgi:hypothetical protein
VRGVEHLPEHVELGLLPRLVAHAYGPAAAVAGQVLQLMLAEVPLPSTPYMIWTSSPPLCPAALANQSNSRAGSSGQAAIHSERIVRLRSRSQAKR